MPGPPKRIVYILRRAMDPSRHYGGLASDVDRRLAGEHTAGQDVHAARARPLRPVASISAADPRGRNSEAR